MRCKVTYSVSDYVHGILCKLQSYKRQESYEGKDEVTEAAAGNEKGAAGADREAKGMGERALLQKDRLLLEERYEGVVPVLWS